MQTTFSPIKIVGMDENHSRPSDQHSKMFNVHLVLSGNAPSEWVDLFNRAWEHRFYSMKRSATAFSAFIQIRCPLEEVATDQLPELKRAVAETNDAYAALLARQEERRKREEVEAVEVAQKVLAVKSGLNFD